MEHSDASKVATQHRLIESLLEGAARAAGAGEALAASKLASLERALEAHFVLEEEHYFPRTRAARPDLEASLDALVREHEVIREMLARAAEHLDAADTAATAREIAALTSLFHRHEAVESGLLEA